MEVEDGSGGGGGDGGVVVFDARPPVAAAGGAGATADSDTSDSEGGGGGGAIGTGAGGAGGGADAEDERMELSATTRVAQEQHAAVLMKLEVERLARSMFVPADVEEQKRLLRSMGEPVTLFGEDAGDRRSRLKTVLAAAQVRATAGGGGLPTDAAAAAARGAGSGDGGGGGVREQFYTPASAALVTAREAIAAYSWGRAAKRTRAAAAVAVSAEACAAEDACAARLYRTLPALRPVASQAGDERPMSSCALSADGAVLATSSWGGAVKVWHARSLAHAATLRGHTDRVVSVAWHPAAGAAGHRPHHGDAADAHHEGVHAAGSLLASGSVDSTVRLWRLPRATLAAPDSVSGSSSSSSSSAGDGSVSEAACLRGHTLRLSAVAFHPSGAHLGSASYDRTWRLWDVEYAAELQLQEGHSREVYGFAFHPDGSLAASGDLGGVVRLWDLRSGKCIWVPDGHAMQVLALDFSPNGYTLASGSGDNTARVWDLRTRRVLNTLPAHTNLISRVK